ncbi:MAG: hypothetical protein KGJ78_00370 [Alphaproteobacteria bacterium]|nr:hypothetical protein [Alphaproteobacteria bacterium]
MLNLTHTLKLSVFSGLLTLVTMGASAPPALAASDGRLYCDNDGDHCYRVERYDRGGYYDSDYSDRNHYRFYQDFDNDRGTYRVCDSDGDRCYLSREPYWNYREYYRRHGYHWDD